MLKRKLIASKMKTPDGTILHSKHAHDYVSHKDANGKTYALDGGNEYIRVVGDILDLEDVSVYEDAPFEILRENLFWGTYGKDGDQPFKKVTLSEMSDDHIKAVIKTQVHISDWLKEKLMNEIYFRDLNPDLKIAE